MHTYVNGLAVALLFYIVSGAIVLAVPAATGWAFLPRIRQGQRHRPRLCWPPHSNRRRRRSPMPRRSSHTPPSSPVPVMEAQPIGPAPNVPIVVLQLPSVARNCRRSSCRSRLVSAIHPTPMFALPSGHRISTVQTSCTLISGSLATIHTALTAIMMGLGAKPDQAIPVLKG